MRSLTITLLLMLCFSCLGTKNKSASVTTLSGTWKPIMQEIGGKTLPVAAFENQQLIITDSSYTVIAESVDKGLLTYKDGKMDIYGKEGVNAGKHITAIYKVEKNQLFICYNLKGDAYPETFDTGGKPNYFFSLFKKK